MDSKNNLPVLKDESVEKENLNPYSFLVPTSDNAFYSYIKRINNIPSLTKEEEFLLAKNYLENNDINAAHKLVTSHMKLVVKIAMSYKNYGLPIIDLISEGNLGLLHSIKKFDPDRGYRLSTYAMWWIKATIQEYILKSWSIVKIGSSSEQKKLFFSLRKIKMQISNENSRNICSADYNKIAKDMNVSINDVIEIDNRFRNFDISLNQTVRDSDNSLELQNLLPNKAPQVDILIEKHQQTKNRLALLRDAIKILNGRELDIFKSRRLVENPDTLDSLSNKYNISKERVRQIENKAFAKIQKYIISSIPDTLSIYEKK